MTEKPKDSAIKLCEQADDLVKSSLSEDISDMDMGQVQGGNYNTYSFGASFANELFNVLKTEDSLQANVVK